MIELDNEHNNMRCYYCGKDAFDREEWYNHTMYYIHKRTSIPLGYKYSEEKITIPRCKLCREQHEKFWGRWLALFILIVVFGLLLCFLYKQVNIWWEYFILVFFCGLSAMIVAGLSGEIIESLFSKMCTGIPPEDDISRYPLVQEMLNSGWVLSRPDPASHPQTGKELRDEKEQSDHKN